MTDDNGDATDDFDPNDFNEAVIAEFRANEGKVGGMFEGRTMLLLHSTGAKSGHERIAPLVYRPVSEAWAIFASKGGAPTNPDWYHNLTANPAATIEVGTATVPVVARVARVAEGDERDRIWEQQKQDVPGFADYEKATERTIPVVILERA